MMYLPRNLIYEQIIPVWETFSPFYKRRIVASMLLLSYLTTKSTKMNKTFVSLIVIATVTFLCVRVVIKHNQSIIDDRYRGDDLGYEIA